MAGGVPPDLFMPGAGAICAVIAREAGVDLARVGGYVVLVQLSLPSLEWDVIVGPDEQAEHVPEMFRAIAAQMEDRNRRLSN